jgi:hypothetical protein
MMGAISEAAGAPAAMSRFEDDPDLDRRVEAVLKDVFPAVGDAFLRRLVGCRALRFRYALVVAGAGSAGAGPAEASLLAFWVARDYGTRIESGVWGPRPEGFDEPGGAGYRAVVRGLLTAAEAPLGPDLATAAGVPLLDDEGRAIGQLALLGPEPGVEEADARSLLLALAPRAAAALAHRESEAPLPWAAAARLPRPRPLITVCAWCERVRDDHRVWRGLAEYVSLRLGVGFTHGICPDCLREHEP